MKTHHGFCKTIIFGIFAFSFCFLFYFEKLFWQWKKNDFKRVWDVPMVAPDVGPTLQQLCVRWGACWERAGCWHLWLQFWCHICTRGRSLSPAEICPSCQKTDLFLQRKDVSPARWHISLWHDYGQISFSNTERSLLPTDRSLSCQQIDFSSQQIDFSLTLPLAWMDEWGGWVMDGCWMDDGWLIMNVWWMMDDGFCVIGNGW